MKFLKQVTLNQEEETGRFSLEIEYSNNEKIYIALEKSLSAKSVAERFQQLTDYAIQVAKNE